MRENSDNSVSLRGDSDTRASLRVNSDKSVSLSGVSDNRASLNRVSDNRFSLSGDSDNRVSSSGVSDNRFSLSGDSDNRVSLSGVSDNRASLKGESENWTSKGKNPRTCLSGASAAPVNLDRLSQSRISGVSAVASKRQASDQIVGLGGRLSFDRVASGRGSEDSVERGKNPPAPFGKG